MNTNFLPIITDDSIFSSGRLNVISFERHFKSEEQDRSLKDKLRKPRAISGIFNWCIEGLKIFRKEGANPPDSVVESTSEYRQNSDKLMNFIAECLEKSDKNTKAHDVYRVYKQWCEENGFGTENKGNFLDELRSKNMLSKNGTVDGITQSNVVKGYVFTEKYRIRYIDISSRFDTPNIVFSSSRRANVENV